MVKASKGLRSKTRKILSKGARRRGLSPITKSLQEFKVGEKVGVFIDPSIHKGMPHRRFQGLTGTIIGTQGKAYLLEVKEGNKVKTLIVNAEHLKKLG